MTTYTDFHVHILGNGSSGSGCWMNLKGRYRLLGEYIVRHLGLPSSSLFGDLDQLYVKKLLEYLSDSPIHKAVILAHENVYDDNGKLLDGIASFYVPNSYILDLARAHKQFIPAVSIHPARPDALDELELCIAGGAKVMKCLPNCQNINCSDPRYEPFWRRMAEAKMILLAHTGGEMSVPVVNHAYADPRILRLPLECGVTVVAAHSATSSGFSDPNYFSVFCELLDQFPNLYGDNSALNSPLRSSHLKNCLGAKVAKRIIHGSDLPIPISGLWATLRGLISWKTFRQIERNKNLLTRDYELKRAMGFPEESFTTGAKLLGV
jgi:uncharacterized protein